jgi:hypothetical protein
MSDKQNFTMEMMTRREHDIELMQLVLKHNLTKRRAEYKLLIMYFKACNMLSRTRMVLSGADSDDSRTHDIPEIHDDAKRVSLWENHFEKLASTCKT